MITMTYVFIVLWPVLSSWNDNTTRDVRTSCFDVSLKGNR